jgi:hypothetical protein
MNVTSPTISEALTTTNKQRSFSSTMIAITIKHLHPILFFNKLDNMSLINHLTLTDLSWSMTNLPSNECGVLYLQIEYDVSKGKYTSPLHDSGAPRTCLCLIFHNDLIKVTHSVNHAQEREVSWLTKLRGYLLLVK